MALATGKRPKTVIVQKQSIDQASTFLQELPEKPKENLSLREAIDKLRDQIQGALAKGYSYDDLAKMLSDKGIGISASTLKNYVPSGKRQASKDKAAAALKPRGRRRKIQEDSILGELVSTVPDIEVSTAEPAEITASESPAEEPVPAPPKRGRGRAKGSSAARSSEETPDMETKPRRSGRRPRASTAGDAAKTTGRTGRGRKKSV